jgi:hypothetical protein
MSVRMSVYVGPVVVVDLLRKTQKVKTWVRMCPECKEWRDSKFCPSCGCATERVEEERNEEILLHEILEDSDLDNKYEMFSNYDNMIGLGHTEGISTWLEGDEEIVDFPERRITVEDIEDLAKVLSDHGLEFKLRHGIVQDWG